MRATHIVDSNTKCFVYSIVLKFNFNQSTLIKMPRDTHYDIVCKPSFSVPAFSMFWFQSCLFHFWSSSLLICLRKQQRIPKVVGSPWASAYPICSHSSPALDVLAVCWVKPLDFLLLFRLYIRQRSECQAKLWHHSRHFIVGRDIPRLF